LIAGCAHLTGEIEQIPPNYSAIKVGGRRAFRRARSGEDFVLPARPVSVFSMEANRLAADRLVLTIACGPGVYIRRLGEDLARFLGTVGHLTSLRRLGAGALNVQDATAPTDLGPASIWTTAQLLAALGEPLALDSEAARWVRDGKPLDAVAALHGLSDGRYGVFCDADPVALIARDQGAWQIIRGIPEVGAP
jgi:tRNA pseudouridine55 synthase